MSRTIINGPTRLVISCHRCGEFVAYPLESGQEVSQDSTHAHWDSGWTMRGPYGALFERMMDFCPKHREHPMSPAGNAGEEFAT